MLNIMNIPIWRNNGITFLGTAVFCFNFLSYSVQPFIPATSSYSLSYAVEDCPSHKNTNPISGFFQFVNESENNDGDQRQCFCHTCTINGSALIFVKSYLDIILDPSVNNLNRLDDFIYPKFSFRHGSNRSPPFIL
jgi:hypothetical protein